MKMFRLLFFFLPVFVSSPLLAQVPAGTDVWLLNMKQDNGKITLSGARNITHRTGYDNQPSFTPDGSSLLYTSIREDNQADIYRYDIKTGSTSQLTSTSTSEYSPTVMPGGKYFSVVMVEKDSAQRLWKYPLKGGEPKLVFPAIDSVGYHCWYSRKSAALFILTSPFTLQLATEGPGKTQLLARNIGRSIHHIKKNKHDLILYVYASEQETSKYIMACDAKGGSSYMDPIKTLEGSEDFAVMNNNTLLMAQGSKLFRYRLGKDKIWNEIADLSSSGIMNITRLAVSNDGTRIAVVSNSNP
jgi:dipeptidyl aminopeptidase/acylaminoacyl peptidase